MSPALMPMRFMPTTSGAWRRLALEGTMEQSLTRVTMLRSEALRSTLRIQSLLLLTVVNLASLETLGLELNTFDILPAQI